MLVYDVAAAAAAASDADEGDEKNFFSKNLLSRLILLNSFFNNSIIIFHLLSFLDQLQEHINSSSSSPSVPMAEILFVYCLLGKNFFSYFSFADWSYVHLYNIIITIITTTAYRNNVINNNNNNN